MTIPTYLQISPKTPPSAASFECSTTCQAKAVCGRTNEQRTRTPRSEYSETPGRSCTTERPEGRRLMMFRELEMMPRVEENVDSEAEKNIVSTS